MIAKGVSIDGKEWRRMNVDGGLKRNKYRKKAVDSPPKTRFLARCFDLR